MNSSPSRTGRRSGVRFALCLGALLASLAFVGGPASGVAAADCRSGGSGCLPGSGYTLDSVWNCGALTTSLCYANGTMIPGNAVNHTWGWGSASNSSFGNAVVCITLGTYVAACGNNLARVCYAASCNDQNANSFRAWVSNIGGGTYVVSGHAKA